MRLLKVLGVVFAIYVVLGLTLDGLIGYFQPQSQGTVVLRTFDAAGGPQDTVLSLRVDGEQLWVESGHWFRGWYNRLLENPEIELILDVEPEPYLAVPVNTPDAVEHMTRLMGKGNGAGYWVGRVMLLFAPVKPVRLDPRVASSPRHVPGRAR